MKHSFLSATALIATFGWSLLTAPAQAAVLTGHGADLVLRYRKVDLATADGRARTYAQLETATAQVCARYQDRELSRQQVYRRCVDQVLDAAVARMGDPALQALHDGARQGNSPQAHATPIRSARR